MERDPPDPHGSTYSLEEEEALRSRDAARQAFARAVLAAESSDAAFKGEIDWLRRQKPVGLDGHGGVILAFGTEEEAERARDQTAVAVVSNKLRELALAPGLHCVAEGVNGGRLPPADPAASVEDPRARLRVACLPACLVRTTLPHTRPKASEFTRRDGAVETVMHAPKEVGLPYGVYARLLLMEITTGALITGSREFSVGADVNVMLRRLDIGHSGGKRGESTRARDQMRRLCATTLTTTDHKGRGGRNVVLVDKWAEKGPGGVVFKLGERFWAMLRSGSVPLDKRIVDQLRRSPLAIDLYAWLTYRTSYLAEETRVPWTQVLAQLGSGIANRRQFKWRVSQYLQALKKHWPSLDAEAGDTALIIRPCPPSVPRRSERQRTNK